MLSLHTWGKYKGCRMGWGELITNISADWPPSVCPLGAKCTNTKSARAKESRVRADMRRREYRAYLCCDSGWRAVVRSTGPAGEREPGGPARQSPRPPGRTGVRRKKREPRKRGAYHTAAEPGEALAWSASWWRRCEHYTDTSANALQRQTHHRTQHWVARQSRAYWRASAGRRRSLLLRMS